MSINVGPKWDEDGTPEHAAYRNAHEQVTEYVLYGGSVPVMPDGYSDAEAKAWEAGYEQGSLDV